MWESLSLTCDRSVVSLGTPVSSTNKTDRHDINEILLKVVLNTINHKPKSNKIIANLPFIFIILIYSSLFGPNKYYLNTFMQFKIIYYCYLLNFCRYQAVLLLHVILVVLLGQKPLEVVESKVKRLLLKTLCLQDWVHPKAWLMQGPRQHSRIQGFVIR